MQVIININAKLAWSIHTDRESRELIAACAPLGLVMHGKDVPDLQASINETLNLLFRNLMKEGELDAFLCQHGWSKAEVPIELNDGSEPSFNVPWELVAAQGDGNGQARAVH